MKTVYLALMLHGNMCYDRYTKHTIRGQFPRLYRTAVAALRRHPQAIAHIDLTGLTIKSLQLAAPDLLADLVALARRGQVVFVGCQYAASHAICCDGETDARAARLTMDIIREELGLTPQGFFPQETVRHPQTPWVMNQAGARWVIIPDRDWKRPKRLLGLDGSEVIGIPFNQAHLPLSALERTFDECEDGDLLVTGGDFEMLADMDALVAELERLKAQGKPIEFATFDCYLDEHPVREEVRLQSPAGYQPEDWEASPSFGRWTADPSDIEVHRHARRAMAAVRTAGMLAAIARTLWEADCDPPWTAGAAAVPDNPWSADFEGPEEFPEVAERYLGRHGQRTLLGEAWHQLLVGVNSDARGWHPLESRRRHRMACCDAAVHLADAVCRHAMAALAARLAPVEPLRDASRCFVIFNPTPARERQVCLPTLEPVEVLDATGSPLPTRTEVEDHGLSAIARVQTPPFGYAVIGVRPAHSSRAALWESGSSAENGGMEVALTDGALVITRGRLAARLTLAPFRLTDPLTGASETVAATLCGAATRVSRDNLCPRLEVCAEPAWGLETRLVVDVWPDEVTCDWQFRFDLPRQVGEGGWAPQGLLALLEASPGETWYDVPVGTIRHPNDGASFFAANRFAALCGPEGTIGLVPLTGEQCFFSNAAAGQLGLCLGASTDSAPRERPECTIDERGYAHHHTPTIPHIFSGRFRHRFALRLGDGDWRSLGLPAVAWSHSQQPFIRATAPADWRGSLPPTGTLLRLSPENVEISAVRLHGQRPQVVLSETHGQEARLALAIGRSAWEATLRPFQLLSLEL